MGFIDWKQRRYGSGMDGRSTPTGETLSEHRKHCKAKPGNCPFERRLDEVDLVDRNATSAEHEAIERGIDPESPNVEPVPPSAIKTLGKTESQFRNLRNEAFDLLAKMQAEGKTDLDGTYPLPIGHPPKKVQHRTADGKMADGFADGFQVSFQTTNGEGFNPAREFGEDGKPLFMSDADYDETVDRLMRETGSKAYVGIFGGIPEVSFRCETLKQAMDIAKKYNQVSIANNAYIAAGKFDDPETFPRNENYQWKDNQVFRMKKTKGE